MKGILGVAGAALAVKAATGFAIVAVAAVVATEIATSGGINPAVWGRQANHEVTPAKVQGHVLSEAPQAGSVSGADLSAGALGTGDAKSQTGQGGSAASQASGKASPPKVTTDAESSDPPMVAVQTKFIPKP